MFGRARLTLMQLTLPLRCLEVAYRRVRSCGNRRRQRGRKDERRRIRAHRVDNSAVCRDITAERAETFGERAFDHVDAMHNAVAIGNTAAAWAVKADGVDLVHVGHRVVALGEISDRSDRGNVAVHRIEALEHYELR